MFYIGNKFDEAFIRDGAYKRFDEESRKEIKSHLLLSQLKTIELLKEELEGMKNEMPYPNANNGWQKELEGEEKGFNSALSQAITLLDRIIQDIKSQIK